MVGPPYPHAVLRPASVHQMYLHIFWTHLSLILYLFLCSTDWLIGCWWAFLLVFIRARELPCVRFSSSGLKHSREPTRSRQWKTDVTLLLARINFKAHSGHRQCTDCLLSHLLLCLCLSLSLWFPIKEEEEKDDDDESKDVSVPTHWAKLDPKSMKVGFKRATLDTCGDRKADMLWSITIFGHYKCSFLYICA